MALKAFTKSLDDVAEAHRPLYTKAEGGFVVAIDAVDGFALENVAGLKSALEKEREESRTRGDKLRDFDGIDPKEAKRALARVKELGDLDPTKEAEKIAAAKFDELKTQLVTSHTKELDAAKGESEKLAAYIGSLLIDSRATAAIAERKGEAKLILPHVKAQTRVRRDGDEFKVEVVDAQGRARVNGKGEPLSIDELIEEMRADAVFGRAFEGSGASGSGAGGSGGRAGGSGGAGSPKHRGDFESTKAKADWIHQNGRDAFMKLPKAPLGEQ